jgi:AcrR family transcriptional regulator
MADTKKRALTAPVAPPGRRSRRKAATRARIVDAALTLLSRQEYNATTVEQITDAADVGKGTYFNYFASKEHLLHEVSEEQMTLIRAMVAKALAEPVAVTPVFKDIFLTLSQLFSASPILARNLVLANLSNDAARRLMTKNVTERAHLLSTLVKKGQDNGDIRRDLKPEMVARLYLHVYFGNLMYWALQPSLELKSWLLFSFEQFWAGIAAQTSRVSIGGPRKPIRRRKVNL